MRPGRREKELDFIRLCDILFPEEFVDRSAEFYRQVIDELPVSYVLGRVVRAGEGGVASDIQILETNPIFNEMAGMKGKNLSGCRIGELFPGQDHFWSNLIDSLDPVFAGESRSFEFRAEHSGRWFSGTIHSPSPQHIVFLLSDITKQKRAAESMMENLSNITSIINTIPNPVFYKDEEFRYAFFNSAFEEFVGYSKEELVGKKSSEIADADLAVSYDESDWIVANTKQTYSHESQVKHSDGTRHDVLFYKSPILTRYGSLRGIVGIILDITERKRIELELSKFKQAVEQSPTSIVMTDREGNIEYVNPKFTSLTGYTFLEIRGKNPRILKSGQTPREEYLKMWTSIMAGKEWHGEFHNRKKNGDLYWEAASVSAIKNPAGAIAGFIAIKEDITGRKRLEATLMQNEQLVTSLLDSLGDPAILVNADGAISALNEPAASWFSLSKQECIGKNLFALLPWVVSEDRASIFRKVVENGDGPFLFEKTIGDRYFETTIYPVRSASGGVSNVAIYAKEVTQHKKNEELLRELVDRAEQANREKSNFLATMSHEIRTPLNAIIGMTDLTLMTDSDIERLDYLHTVKDSAIHLLSVINDVLDFTKMETGKFELKNETFSLLKVAESVIMLMRGDAQVRGLSMKLEVSQGLPPLLSGDGAAYKQILINLVGNAVKFTEQGGVFVDISHRTAADGRVIVVTHVTDTGIGIPPERMGIIFESFTRANSYTGSKYGGSGLGLSICRNLTRLMKGEISATSVPGKGSEFTVEIPFGIVEEPKKKDRGSADAMPKKKLDVLVAEDNLVNVKFMTIVLGKLGYDYDVAGNGIDAIRWSEKRRYDVILMDVEMPEMDGLEATRRIRSDAASLNKDTPVIALTAHAVVDVQDRCMEAGMNGFITKPVRIEEIERRIGEVLARS